MKMVKSLLLGSAAGLVAVAGAQAADLPVKAKPVEYVKVCSIYGAGFFYIPGTDTCIKIGGWVRAEYALQSGNSDVPFNQGGGGRNNRIDTPKPNWWNSLMALPVRGRGTQWGGHQTSHRVTNARSPTAPFVGNRAQRSPFRSRNAGDAFAKAGASVSGVHLEQIRVLQADEIVVNRLAWDDGRRRRSVFPSVSRHLQHSPGSSNNAVGLANCNRSS
jgi:hypothetical protein